MNSALSKARSSAFIPSRKKKKEKSLRNLPTSLGADISSMKLRPSLSNYKNSKVTVNDKFTYPNRRYSPMKKSDQLMKKYLDTKFSIMIEKRKSQAKSSVDDTTNSSR